jgi:hypothetical protein
MSPTLPGTRAALAYLIRQRFGSPIRARVRGVKQGLQKQIGRVNLRHSHESSHGYVAPVDGAPV